MYDEVFNNDKIFNVLDEPVNEEVINEAKEFLESLGEKPLKIDKISVVNPHLLRIYLELSRSTRFELEIGESSTSDEKDRMSLFYLSFLKGTEENPLPSECINCQNVTKDIARQIILSILDKQGE